MDDRSTRSRNLMQPSHAPAGATPKEHAETSNGIDPRFAVPPRAPSQMIEMAKRFGLTESDIAAPQWRASEIMATCRQCEVANRCFDYLLGEREKDFTELDCPNAGRYSETALERK